MSELHLADGNSELWLLTLGWVAFYYVFYIKFKL